MTTELLQRVALYNYHLKDILCHVGHKKIWEDFNLREQRNVLDSILPLWHLEVF